MLDLRHFPLNRCPGHGFVVKREFTHPSSRRMSIFLNMTFVPSRVLGVTGSRVIISLLLLRRRTDLGGIGYLVWFSRLRLVRFTSKSSIVKLLALTMTRTPAPYRKTPTLSRCRVILDKDYIK